MTIHIKTYDDEHIAIVYSETNEKITDPVLAKRHDEIIKAITNTDDPDTYSFTKYIDFVNSILDGDDQKQKDELMAILVLAYKQIL